METDKQETNREHAGRNLSIECEVYSRVTGFYRPVSHFNPGKKEEFRERQFMSMARVADRLR